jgi:hypothetical protein
MPEFTHSDKLNQKQDLICNRVFAGTYLTVGMAQIIRVRGMQIVGLTIVGFDGRPVEELRF